ncbi:MAG: D-alanine--D-alanine ligase [Thermoleophilaceae bacterium]|nr:D-alanine--D-alanine ligase [Thermoleophilaceae bacterium]
MSGTVVVACGGRSLEREISIRSGRRAATALRKLGYETEIVDPDHGFVRRIRELQPAFVFVALHGRGGEDGTLQDLLEILEVPYTGSGVHASARCLDKHSFKELLARERLPTPAWHSFNSPAFAEFGAADTLEELIAQLSLPLVIKPAREGSSMGIKFVRDPGEFGQAVLGALSYDDRVVIERYAAGRELAVTVLGPSEDPSPLPIVEIVTDEPFYTFRAHYEPGEAVLSIADLDAETEAAVTQAACAAYAAADCRDLGRVDIILDGEGVPQILEINTIPGLTETGPTRFAAQAAELSFDQLIEIIVARVADRTLP